MLYKHHAALCPLFLLDYSACYILCPRHMFLFLIIRTPSFTVVTLYIVLPLSGMFLSLSHLYVV